MIDVRNLVVHETVDKDGNIRFVDGQPKKVCPVELAESFRSGNHDATVRIVQFNMKAKNIITNFNRDASDKLKSALEDLMKDETDYRYDMTFITRCAIVNQEQIRNMYSDALRYKQGLNKLVVKFEGLKTFKLTPFSPGEYTSVINK